MEEGYLDYLECYEDTIDCLERNVIDEEEALFLVEHYEYDEHFECCQAILNAIEDYKINKINNKNDNTKRDSNRD